jgi:hypothetical protein
MRSACGMLIRHLRRGTSDEDDVYDPVPEHEQVPFWAWGSVFVASIIVTCVVMGVQFGQNVGVTILGETGYYFVGGTSLTGRHSHYLLVPLQLYWVRKFRTDQHQSGHVNR